MRNFIQQYGNFLRLKPTNFYKFPDFKLKLKILKRNFFFFFLQHIHQKPFSNKLDRRTSSQKTLYQFFACLVSFQINLVFTLHQFTLRLLLSFTLLTITISLYQCLRYILLLYNYYFNYFTITLLTINTLLYQCLLYILLLYDYYYILLYLRLLLFFTSAYFTFFYFTITIIFYFTYDYCFTSVYFTFFYFTMAIIFYFT